MDRKKRKFIPEISINECKGCERCVYSCPKKVLRLENSLNSYGYRFATYVGEGCIGCASCYYTCPEPGAISIYEETEEEN